jgi:predicted phage replisome organizer
MAEVKWVKLTVDMFDNRKIKYIRKLPEGNNIVLIWVMLLTMAGRCNAGGMIFLTENVPYTPKMLADELDFEENTVILALQALENLNMIVADNGFFAIAGWDKYQNIDGMEKIKEQNRKRQAKFKKKKKLLIGNVTDNVTVTQGNATEEEKEEEKEKEEEIHSFIHSNVREGEDAEKEPTGNFDDRESIRLKYLGGTLGKGVVMLSDEQLADLLDKLSVEEFDKYVGIVAECELKGKRYTNKTHYQAILDMANKDRKVI